MLTSVRICSNSYVEAPKAVNIGSGKVVHESKLATGMRWWEEEGLSEHKINCIPQIVYRTLTLFYHFLFVPLCKEVDCTNDKNTTAKEKSVSAVRDPYKSYTILQFTRILFRLVSSIITHFINDEHEMMSIEYCLYREYFCVSSVSVCVCVKRVSLYATTAKMNEYFHLAFVVFCFSPFERGFSTCPVHYNLHFTSLSTSLAAAAEA